MKKGDFIFVYGTLRRGERADLSKNSSSFSVTYIGDDRINGRMYHIGSYPGVKHVRKEFSSDSASVVGEVFLAKDASISALLDAYEGYDADNPGRGLYDRVQVETESGRVVWVYIYNPPVRAEQEIVSGDWVRNREMILNTPRKVA